MEEAALVGFCKSCVGDEANFATGCSLSLSLPPPLCVGSDDAVHLLSRGFNEVFCSEAIDERKITCM